MVKIPPMMGSGIQRRHAAIFGESPENTGQLSDTFDRKNSKWVFLKIHGHTKTGKWKVHHKIESERFLKFENRRYFKSMKIKDPSKT